MAKEVKNEKGNVMVTIGARLEQLKEEAEKRGTIPSRLGAALIVSGLDSLRDGTADISFEAPKLVPVK